MLQRDGTPKSSQAVELQETDALILNGKALTPVSYTNVSSSFSSLSSLKLNNNELSIILIGAAAGNFLGNFYILYLNINIMHKFV